MTNRTVKVKGLVYGSSPATITATLQGVPVFSGSVASVDQPVPTLPDPTLTGQTQDLFTFEIPMDLAGNIPMTVTNSGATVIYAQIVANYANAGGTTMGANSFCNINFIPSPSTQDARSNVVIDGVPQTLDRDPSLESTWWWTISSGSTMNYDMVADAGTENTTPPPANP